LRKEIVALAFQNNTVVWYNWLQKYVIGSFQANGNSMIFLKDARFATDFSAGLNIWNMYTGSVDRTLNTYEVSMVELTNGLFVNADLSKNIKFWNLTTGTLVYTISTTANHVYLKQMGNYLASCDDSGNIYIWSLNTYSLFQTLSDVLAQSRYTMRSLNESHLVTASRDGFVQVWDVISGQCLSTYQPFMADIYNFLLINNDTLIIVGEPQQVLFVSMNSLFQFSVINRIYTGPYTWPKDVSLTANREILLIAVGNSAATLAYYNLTSLAEIQTLKLDNKNKEIWNLLAYVDGNIYFLSRIQKKSH
jgi:WD40 repeat protein